MKRKGFTLIELIVVMAVIGILALIGLPKYLSYTKEAKLTEIKVQASELEKASIQHYIKNNAWPRLTDEHYTAEQVKDFGEKILSSTGIVIELELEGKYYDIDYQKLSNHIKEPRNKNHYILQNPVGSVFYIDNISDKGISRESLETDGNGNVGNRTMLNLNFMGKMNSGSDRGKITDISGLGNDSLLNNFSYTNSSGWTSDGLTFDGVNDYVLVPTKANKYVKPVNELTVSIRAYSQNWQQTNRMALISCTQYGGWNMLVNGGYGTISGKGYLTYGINTSGNNLNYSVSYIKLSDISPGWHTFTGVYDGRYARLYMDGKLYDTVDMGSYLEVVYNKTNALVIGAEAGEESVPVGDYWKGKISYVSIYDRSLTPEEVKNIYLETKNN